ncbi:DUF742 domain-containing protein [Saccharomonospora xinjiangensis]|uniref:DUF742 domain-containing protein n=1 Tax=Saccharomonospora xinjiangensis TaxID=75294 RepID=UPI00106F7363|nr:DUF742 domain-containing protein [Saccharomonospora xinjiangensis]QBQ62141.1 hypothetical protein EYD13_19010 [Saccharomonospora xinjiangensis]
MADGVDEWEALNRPTDREGFDHPSKFDLNSVSGITQLAKRVRQQSGQAAGPSGFPRSAPAPYPEGRRGGVPSQPRTAQAPPHFTHRSLVRPYARTGGRTRPAKELALEALVVTTDRGRRYEGVVSPEQRFICDLCVDVHSVAEIAAFARLPLGVVKVLVDDLAHARAVDIQRPGFVLADRDSHDFMERILNGLRSL